MFPPDSFAYCRDNTLHIRDSEGHHWTAALHHRSGKPYIKTLPKNKTKLYGRPSVNRSYKETMRDISHGLMNAVSQEGSWAWYTGFGGKKVQASSVKHGYIPERKHTIVMNQATEDELGQECNATEYARLGHGAWFTKGHGNIGYEWCHLVSHGLKGADDPANIVAATKYQNTEQLILETVLYEYRMENLSIRVQAKLASKTAHLAESVYYEVLLPNSSKAYTRTMDARRATNVTYAEYCKVSREMRQSINSALSRLHPMNGIDPEVLKHVEDNTDSSEGYFRMC